MHFRKLHGSSTLKTLKAFDSQKYINRFQMLTVKILILTITALPNSCKKLINKINMSNNYATNLKSYS